MAHASTKIRVLIVDGQNNHNVWPKSTAMMKSYLEETGKSEVDLARTRYTWKGEKWLSEYALNECVGFIVTFLRGTEWAATGRVTIPVPPDFPTEAEAKHRPFVDS